MFGPIGPKMKDYVSVIDNDQLFCMGIALPKPQEIAKIWDMYTDILYNNLSADENIWISNMETQTRDDESVQTLRDIIYNNMSVYINDSIDFVRNAQWGIMQRLRNGSDTPALILEELEPKLQTQIDDLLNSGD